MKKIASGTSNGGGGLPLASALPSCHPGAEGDRVQGKSSATLSNGPSDAGPQRPGSIASALEAFRPTKVLQEMSIVLIFRHIPI